MNGIQEQYERETGEKALYRKGSSDYHTLDYVRWLEKRIPKVATNTALEIHEAYKSGYNAAFDVLHVEFIKARSMRPICFSLSKDAQFIPDKEPENAE